MQMPMHASRAQVGTTTVHLHRMTSLRLHIATGSQAAMRRHRRPLHFGSIKYGTKICPLPHGTYTRAGRLQARADPAALES